MNIEKQKATLTAQLSTLTARIESNQEVASQKRDGTSEDDIASLYEMQAKAHAAIKMDKQHLTQVRAALRRIEEGEYEFCESCDEDINPKRLEANPIAKLCIDCATHRDHVNKQYA